MYMLFGRREKNERAVISELPARNPSLHRDVGREFRSHFKKWSSSRSSRSTSSGSHADGSRGHTGVEKYSDEWWFWSEAGRAKWKECKEKGEGSHFWKEHKCDRRSRPSKGSKWWWWTSEGRKVWKECKAKGPGSGFWERNSCGSGK